MTEEIQDLTPVDGADGAAGEGQGAAAPSWSDDDESEARVFGWKSSDEWVGEKPRGYMDDPRDYMDRVKRSKTFTAMQDRIESASRESADNSRKIAAAYERAEQQRKDQFERAMQNLTAQQREAASKQDLVAYDQIERDKDALRRQASPVRPEPQQPATDPSVADYRSKNAWAQDPVIWQEMHAAVDAGLRSGALRTSSPAEQLEYAEKSIRTRYPHLFQSAARPQAPMRPQVDGGGVASSRTANPFDKLPPDAKSAFAKFAKDGLFSNDEAGKRRFAEDYHNG